jgi:hypothetical protein
LKSQLEKALRASRPPTPSQLQQLILQADGLKAAGQAHTELEDKKQAVADLRAAITKVAAI